VDFYFEDQCHSGEGRATSGEVERTRLIAIASILMDFALVVLEGPQLARPTPTARRPLLMLLARSLADLEGPAQGRLDPFAARLAMTAICAIRPAGVEVNRTFADRSVGR
jgi:hypothetical protein